jgi:preprotein translocase subunit Sss1
MARPRREMALALGCAGIIFGIVGFFDFPLIFGAIAFTCGTVSYFYAPPTEREFSLAAILLGIGALAFGFLLLLISP